MKKLISVLLVLVLFVSVIAPAASAVEPENEYPIILLTGDGASIYDAEGNEIYPYNFTGDSGDGRKL